jgi:hypothetical protein
MVASVHRHHFHTRAEPCLKTATWIAVFHNVKRGRSADDGLPPVTFERQIIEKRPCVITPVEGRCDIESTPKFEGIDKTGTTMMLGPGLAS